MSALNFYNFYEGSWLLLSWNLYFFFYKIINGVVQEFENCFFFEMRKRKFEMRKEFENCFQNPEKKI